VEYTTTVENSVTTSETKFYLDDFAVVIETPNCHKLHYLNGDRLGSIDTITNAQGDVVERHGYDAFGKPRAGNWLLDSTAGGELNARLGLYSTVTHRGFTGHEHLDSVGLIHMNGRAYDPELGRFLSVDPFIQFPDNSQSLNPYTYVMNNPLSGTDPTGYLIRYNAGSAFAPTVIYQYGRGGQNNGAVTITCDLCSVKVTTERNGNPDEIAVVKIDNVSKIEIKESKGNVVISYRSTGSVKVYSVGKQIKLNQGVILPGGQRDVFGGKLKRSYDNGVRVFVDDSNKLTRIYDRDNNLISFTEPDLELSTPLLDLVFVGKTIVNVAVARTGLRLASEESVVTKSGVLDGANFAQKTFGKNFSAAGKFAGQTVDDVAGAIQSGALKVSDVPIDYIVRNGNTLILNTRSSQALIKAGIPRSQWNAINRTGDAAFEARLTGQLNRNNLTEEGISAVRQSGGL